MIGASVWGKNATTVRWIFLGGATKTGTWTQSFPSGSCVVRADGPSVDGLVYSQARVATWAYRNGTFPTPGTIPLQVTSILVID